MSGVLPADEVADMREWSVLGHGEIVRLLGSHEALRSQLAAAHDVIRRHLAVLADVPVKQPDEPIGDFAPKLAAWIERKDASNDELRAVLDAADATPTEAHDGE